MKMQTKRSAQSDRIGRCLVLLVLVLRVGTQRRSLSDVTYVCRLKLDGDDVDEMNNPASRCPGPGPAD